MWSTISVIQSCFVSDYWITVSQLCLSHSHCFPFCGRCFAHEKYGLSDSKWHTKAMGRRKKRTISVSPISVMVGTPDKWFHGSTSVTELFSSYVQPPVNMATNMSRPMSNCAQQPVIPNFTQSATPTTVQTMQSPNRNLFSPAQNQCYSLSQVQQPVYRQNTVLGYQQGGVNGSMQRYMQFVKTMFDNIDWKLGKMDSKLMLLDNINKQMMELNVKVASMDRQISSVETQLNEISRQITELQASRAFNLQTCDEIKHAQSDISKQITDINATKSSLASFLWSDSTFILQNDWCHPLTLLL